jgi:hypothetical protein
VPDPSELIATARLLLGAPGSAAPTQAQLRRAASTAYYAVFHKVLRAAAERFAGLGQEHSGAYAILYRSFDHGHMKQMCEALLKSTLPDALKWRLRRDAVSQETRDFAGSFPALQEIRHLADYDPTIVFLASDVSAACRLGRGGDRSIHPHPFE